MYAVKNLPLTSRAMPAYFSLADRPYIHGPPDTGMACTKRVWLPRSPLFLIPHGLGDLCAIPTTHIPAPSFGFVPQARVGVLAFSTYVSK